LQFIPVAEETGLILAIGEWVLREACRQAHAWHAGLPRGVAPAVAVNLSARQLQEPGFAAQVADVLAETGLPADALVLEITESILMKDRDSAITRLHELKALGVGLAVDDFGTGYSSLTYLRSFPVDILKIDKAFVDDVGHDPEAAQLAKAIVELGRTLHLSTVAEGIESVDQCEVMRTSSCALGQGYLFSRPTDAASLWELLTDRAGLGGYAPATSSGSPSQRFQPEWSTSQAINP
jgi:EAL domain-containing protein (putative c-di-GMP-specific phosphodiesterase class I)